MGYVGGKIPGHTGTQFKHKKVFKKIKNKITYIRKTNPITLANREAYKEDLLSKRFRVIVAVFSSTILLFVFVAILSSIGNIKLHKSQLSHNYLAEIERKENKDAAVILYNSAKSYYKSEAYDAAQNEIQRVLNIYPTNRQAIQLMSDILKKQCELKGVLCDSSARYQSYLEETQTKI